MDNLTLTLPDDWHLHLRDGEALITTVPDASRCFGRGIVMPNLAFPVVTTDQALTYRLSGDRNPLHSDPSFAKLAGFDRPILHGLCTYGHAGRAILAKACGGSPEKFKSFQARFSGTVYPGDTLITEGWEVEKGKYAIRCTRQTGDLVLSNGIAT